MKYITIPYLFLGYSLYQSTRVSAKAFFGNRLLTKASKISITGFWGTFFWRQYVKYFETIKISPKTTKPTVTIHIIKTYGKENLIYIYTVFSFDNELTESNRDFYGNVKELYSLWLCTISYEQSANKSQNSN